MADLWSVHARTLFCVCSATRAEVTTTYVRLKQTTEAHWKTGRNVRLDRQGSIGSVCPNPDSSVFDSKATQCPAARALAPSTVSTGSPITEAGEQATN